MCSRFNALKNQCDPLTNISITGNYINITPSGGIDVTGDAQYNLYTLRGKSTNPDSTANLFRDGVSQTLDVTPGWAWTFKVSIIGNAQTDDPNKNISFFGEGSVSVNSDATTTKFEMIKDGRIIGSGNATADVTITNTGGVFTFKCTGATSGNDIYHWFATVEATEISINP